MKFYLLVAILVGSLGSPLLVAAADTPAALTRPAVPDPLKVPAGEVLVLVAQAKGVQTYECRAKAGDSAAYEWAFTGPEADLFDTAGTPLGRHYGGPTWELADGSKVVGLVKASVPSPTAGAVPWLLLTAKSHGGHGPLSNVASIQRLETIGGKPPGAPSAQAVGQKVRIPYTATYYFYAPKP